MTPFRYALTVFWLLALGLVQCLVVVHFHPQSPIVPIGVGAVLGFAVVWIGLAPLRHPWRYRR